MAELDLRLDKHVPGGRVALYLFGLGLVAYLALVSLGAHSTPLDWLYDIVPVLAPAFAGFASMRTSFSSRARSRLPWLLLGAGCFSWAIGDLAFVAIERTGGNASAFSADDLGYLVLLPCWAGALIAHLRAVARRRPTLTSSFGGGLILLGIYAATISFVIGPLVRNTHDVRTALVNAAYPVGDLALITFFVALLFFNPRMGRIDSLLGIAILSFASADVLFDYSVEHSTYRTGSSIDVLWIVAFLSIAAAAALSRIRGADGWEPKFEPRRLTIFLGSVSFITLVVATVQGRAFGFLGVVVIFLAALFTVRRSLIQEGS